MASATNTMGIGVVLSFFTMGIGAVMGASHTLKRLREGLMATKASTVAFYSSIKMMVKGLIIMKAGMAGLNFVFGGKDEFASLQTEIAHVQSILRLTSEDMSVFMDRARELAVTYGESSGEIGEGMKVLARAGFSAAETIAMIEPVTQAAIIGEMGLEEAANSVIAAFRSFNMTAAESQHLVDMLARGTTIYRLEMDDYGQAVGRFGASAQAANQDLSTMIAILGTLTTRGLSASRSGTMLKMMLNKLRAPSSAAANTIRSLGIDIYDSSGQMRDILDILGDLEMSFASTGKSAEASGQFLVDTFNGTSDAAGLAMEEAQMLRSLFGQRALVGYDVATVGQAEFNGQILEGIDLIRAQATEIESANGFSTEYTQNIMVTWERVEARLKAAWETIRGLITQSVWPIVEYLLDKVMSGLTRIKGWMDAHPALTRILAITIAISSLVAVVLGFAIALKGVWLLFKMILVAEKGLAVTRMLGLGPIFLIIAGILLLTTLVFIFWDEICWLFSQIEGFFVGLYEGFVGVWNSAITWIETALHDMLGFVGAIIDALIPDWISTVGQGMGSYGETKEMLNQVASTGTYVPDSPDTYAIGATSVPSAGFAYLHGKEEVIPEFGNDEYQKDKSMSSNAGEDGKAKSITIGNVDIHVISSGKESVDAEAIWEQLMQKMKEEVEREFTSSRNAVLV